MRTPATSRTFTKFLHALAEVRKRLIHALTLEDNNLIHDNESFALAIMSFCSEYILTMISS